jgi:hypothetical protein
MPPERMRSTAKPKPFTIHHLDVSWDQARTGESNIRTYKLDGDRLTLMTEPSNDPVTGKKTVRTVIFERMK